MSRRTRLTSTRRKGRLVFFQVRGKLKQQRCKVAVLLFFIRVRTIFKYSFVPKLKFLFLEDCSKLLRGRRPVLVTGIEAFHSSVKNVLGNMKPMRMNYDVGSIKLHQCVDG